MEFAYVENRFKHFWITTLYQQKRPNTKIKAIMNPESRTRFNSFCNRNIPLYLTLVCHHEEVLPAFWVWKRYGQMCIAKSNTLDSEDDDVFGFNAGITLIRPGSFRYCKKIGKNGYCYGAPLQAYLSFIFGSMRGEILRDFLVTPQCGSIASYRLP